MELITKFEQGSAEWLAFRKNHIGSSDASIIMGLNPWCTPYELWQRKLDLIPEQDVSYAMRRGIELEPVARSLFNKEFEIEMKPAVALHETRKWQMASLDGLSKLWTQALEIKCGGKALFDHAINNEIPEYYMVQLQHILSVSGHNEINYYVYYEGEGINQVVKRNDPFIKLMLEKEKAFYDCLINLEQPELCEKDFVKRDDFEWNETGIEINKVRAELKYLAEKEELLKQKLIYLSNGRNSRGANIQLSSYLRKGNVDYGKIPELKDVDLNPYRKKSSIVYRITEKKDV